MAKRDARIAKFDQLKESAKQARLHIDREAWLNLAFFLGEQYTEWKADLNFIRRIPRTQNTQHTPRPVVNKIRHFVQQQHAFAMQNKPMPDPLPATDDLMDVSDAQVANAYANYIAGPEMADQEAVQSTADLWALVTGESYLKWFWCPIKKRPDVVPASLFDLFTDPYATDFYKARYIVHSQFMDPEQVYDQWGQEVEKGSVEKQDQFRAQLLREMGQAPATQGVTINELWMKPTRRHEKGLYAVWSGNQFLVEPTDLPYRHLIRERMLPFTQIGVLERPGSQHWDSHVTDLRPPQMELNKYHAQRILIRQNFSNPKWGIPEELEMQTMPDDSQNQVLRYASPGGQKPEILQPAAMADNNEGEWITSEMMNVVGLHEVSQAQVPGRVEAAKAIEMLKEADTSRLHDLSRTTAKSLALGYYHVVELARQYSPADAIYKTYSREGVPEVRHFKAGELSPGIRFRVRMGTGLGVTRAAREDRAFRLWELGILRDPEQLLEVMDFPSGLNLISAKAQDIKLARNENLELAQGKAKTPNTWDDHEIHLREHNNYRKTAEFALLSEQTRAKFEHHCQLHERYQITELTKLVRKQQLVAALSQPQDPNAGGPPPPGSEGGPANTPADTAAAGDGGDTAGQTPPGTASAES